MGETRRWTVTYTKHIKQKRKVYQDGALEICRSSGVDKAMLYDESGRLLESRYLKKDEVVECGGTLAFDSHLVDIGDPEGDCKPLTDLNVQGRDVKPIERIGIFGTKKAGLGSSSLVTRKPKTGRSGTSGNCQNLIHNNKRGNKEAGREKTGVPHNCHTATEIRARGNEESALEDVGGHKEHQNVMQDTTREWHALYTTQKTQKSKKYHDGILQLKVSVAQRNQVILLKEDGAILGSKYLNSAEDVRTGNSLEITNYLVDVGEDREAKVFQGV